MEIKCYFDVVCIYYIYMYAIGPLLGDMLIFGGVYLNGFLHCQGIRVIPACTFAVTRFHDVKLFFCLIFWVSPQW